MIERTVDGQYVVLFSDRDLDALRSNFFIMGDIFYGRILPSEELLGMSKECIPSAVVLHNIRLDGIGDTVRCLAEDGLGLRYEFTQGVRRWKSVKV